MSNYAVIRVTPSGYWRVGTRNANGTVTFRSVGGGHLLKAGYSRYQQQGGDMSFAEFSKVMMDNTDLLVDLLNTELLREDDFIIDIDSDSDSDDDIPEPEPIPPLKSPSVVAPNFLSANFVCKKGVEWDEPLPFYK